MSIDTDIEKQFSFMQFGGNNTFITSAWKALNKGTFHNFTFMEEN